MYRKFGMIIRKLSVNRYHADDIQGYWLPFTNNREFRNNPIIFEKAKGLFYYLQDGKEVLDGISGLWYL
jgi:beta-alanine--pyruvate transaminase